MMLTKDSILYAASRVTEEQLLMYYLGQVGFLFAFRGKFLLVDGYLSDSIDRRTASDETPWQRAYPSPIRGCELDFVDGVLCSHTHTDHTDPDTISAILSVNRKAVFYGTCEVARHLAALGVPENRICALHNDECMDFSDGIRIKNVPAAHEELHPDADGQYMEGGFLLTFGAVKVYHAGDCCLWDGLEERVMHSDIAILPVNGRDYYRRYRKNIIGNFDCLEAVTLAEHIGADLLIPAHIDLYAGNGLNPAVFADTVENHNPAQKYHIFRPGEAYLYIKQ